MVRFFGLGVLDSEGVVRVLDLDVVMVPDWRVVTVRVLEAWLGKDVKSFWLAVSGFEGNRPGF